MPDNFRSDHFAVTFAGAYRNQELLLGARGLRAFGDGYVSLLLPYYLTLLGFGGLAGDFAYIAKILLLVFVVLVIVSLVLGRGAGPLV